MKSFARICLLLLAGVALGCGRPQPGWGVRSVEWSHSPADREAIPGIDEFSVRLGTYGDSVAVVFWCTKGGTFGSNYDQQAKAVRYDGKFRAVNGRECVIECLTPDGISGSVTIDGQKFDMTKGSLFLISAKEEETTIQQLQNVVPAPPPVERSGEEYIETLKRYAATNADIRQFFMGNEAQDTD